MKTSIEIPDDGFAPVPVGMEAPAVPIPMGAAPEPDFASSVCLKGCNGECDYLWQLGTSFAHGNTEGTFAPGEEPKAIHRSCLRSPGAEMDLKGLTVLSCNQHSDLNFRSSPKPFVFDAPADELEQPAPAPNPIDNMPMVRLGRKVVSDHE
jgi:hypothetical protein